MLFSEVYIKYLTTLKNSSRPKRPANKSVSFSGRKGREGDGKGDQTLAMKKLINGANEPLTISS